MFQHELAVPHVCLYRTARSLESGSPAAPRGDKESGVRSSRWGRGHHCSEEPEDSSAGDQAEHENEEEGEEERLLEVFLEACCLRCTATSSAAAGHADFLSHVNAPSSRSVPSVARAW